jgi:dynein light intermediate chain 2
VTVVVVAAKYDAFERADAELKKIMSRALRHACHAHGASLFYTSGLNAAAAAAGGGEDETSTVASRRARSADDREDDARRLNRFRAYLNHLVFVGADKRYPGRIDPEIDYGGAITVVAGSDRFASIGAPRGASGGASGGDASAAWRALFREAFPPPNGDGGTWVGGGFGSDDGGDVKNRGCPDLGKYPEREVDAERERKAEELASFRKRQAMMKSGGSAVASAAATLRAKVKSGGGAASSRSSSSASAAPVSSSRSSASAASAPSRERSSATGSAAARPSSARSASGVASSRLNSGRTSARGEPAAPSSARRPTMR